MAIKLSEINNYILERFLEKKSRTCVICKVKHLEGHPHFNISGAEALKLAKKEVKKKKK